MTVRWDAAEADADEALRAHVALVVGVDPGSVRVGRLCRRCGSARHGRPWASHGVQVSLARSGLHLVTAVSTVGRVGVDVERVADVDRAGEALPLVSEHGTVLAGTGRTAAWCRTEAALKREGTGFGSALEEGRLEHGVIDDLVAPAGYCAAVAYEES